MVPKTSRNVWIAGWVSLLTDLSSHMIFPLLPFYLTRVLGAGPAIVGLIEGAADSIAAWLKLYSGRWSDRMRRRKPFVVAGYALSTLSKLLFLPAISWGLVLAARVIERLGKGIRSAPRDALVAEETAPEHRGRAFGIQRAMDGAGGMLGALAGCLLIGWFDYRTIFLLALIPAALAVLVALGLRETHSPAPAAVIDTAKVKSALPGSVRKAVLACAVFAFGHLSFAFLLLAGSANGWADQRTLLAYALYMAVYTLASPWAGRWSDRMGRRPLLIAGYAGFALTALLLAVSTGSAWLLAVFVGYGLSEAVTDSVQRAWISDLAPREQRAAALGAYHAAIAIVALPGGLLVGTLWGTLGIPAACAVSLSMTGLAAWALWRIPVSAVPAQA